MRPSCNHSCNPIAYASTVEADRLPHEELPLLSVRVSTPTLELRGATDELVDQLAEVVHAGKTRADPVSACDGRRLGGRIRMSCTVMESSSLTSARCEGRAEMTQPPGGASAGAGGDPAQCRPGQPAHAT